MNPFVTPVPPVAPEMPSSPRNAIHTIHAVAILAGLGLALALAPLAGAENAPTPSTNSTQRLKLSDLFDDEIVARGKGVQVKRSQLEQSLTQLRASMAARGQPVPEELRALQEVRLLERIIVTQILTNRANAADAKAAMETAEKKLKDAKEQAISEETFYRQLKAKGLTFETYRQLVVEEAFAQAVVQRELAGDIKITDEQIKELYTNGTDLYVKLMEKDLEQAANEAGSTDKVAKMKEQIALVRKSNLARLEQAERVRIAHIFMITRDRKTEESLSEEQKKFKRLQLERIRKRALDGEDFAKLVMEYSEDRGLKDTKGEYTFTREDRFAPELKSAAFSLESGKISDIVTTSMGLHIVKLLERMPAKKVELAKVAPDLKEFLTQQEVQRAMPEFFARLSKEAEIEMVDPKYRLSPTTPVSATNDTARRTP